MAKDGTKLRISLLGGTFLQNLQITFIILKLAGVIEWGWIWILTPIWLPALLFLLLFVLGIILDVDNKNYTDPTKSGGRKWR